MRFQRVETPSNAISAGERVVSAFQTSDRSANWLSTYQKIATRTTKETMICSAFFAFGLSLGLSCGRFTIPGAVISPRAPGVRRNLPCAMWGGEWAPASDVMGLRGIAPPPVVFFFGSAPQGSVHHPVRVLTMRLDAICSDRGRAPMGVAAVRQAQ